MRLSQLVLQNYRSYSDAELILEPGPNVLLGFNGVGKTNVAEAIGYLSSLSSHRVTHDGPLIRHGESQAIIRAQAHRDTQSAFLEVEINPGRSNRARINRGAPVRATEALGILRSVLFAPEDLELIKGSPPVRRRFFDALAVQMRPALGAVRQDYEKVLRQRNALLKSIRYEGLTATHQSTLDVWDQQLSQTGARLLKARLEILAKLRPHVSQAYHQLSESVRTARMRYLSSLDIAAEDNDDDVSGLSPDAAESPASQDDTDSQAASGIESLSSTEEIAETLLHGLHDARKKERERGITLVGPHRDEVSFSLDATPVKGYASHGETWSYALALRLGSYHVMLEDDPSPGAEPILVLDDVFAELDARRRQRLAELATGDDGAEQLIVTAAVGDDVPESLRANAYRVESADQPSAGEQFSTVERVSTVERISTVHRERGDEADEL